MALRVGTRRAGRVATCCLPCGLLLQRRARWQRLRRAAPRPPQRLHLTLHCEALLGNWAAASPDKRSWLCQPGGQAARPHSPHTQLAALGCRCRFECVECAASYSKQRCPSTRAVNIDGGGGGAPAGSRAPRRAPTRRASTPCPPPAAPAPRRRGGPTLPQPPRAVPPPRLRAPPAAAPASPARGGVGRVTDCRVDKYLKYCWSRCRLGSWQLN